MTQNSHRLAALAALLLTALLSLTACFGGGTDGGSDGGSATSSDSAEMASPAQAEDSAGGSQDLPKAVAGSGSDDAGGTGPSGETGEQEGASAGPARAPLRTESVIRTGTVSVRADDVGAARFEVQKVVDHHGGSIIEQEAHADGDGGLSAARLVLRVPAAAFADVVTALEGIGTLASSTTSSEDVTQQLIDLDSRIAVQKASIERVRALLAQATDVSEIVSIESELTRRQGDLDSMLQQQAYLADRSALSTVTVHLERPPTDEERTEDDDEGFLAGLSTGWKALGGSAVVAATITGALLPWLVLAALVGVPIWLAVRRRRTAPAAVEQPAP